MKEYSIGEIFEDSENFNPPKRIKCVENVGCLDSCVYRSYANCSLFPKCTISERKDHRSVVFIETEEPLSDVTE
jgi:hypothetical protein